MAAPLNTQYESGTYRPRHRPTHNGYYAGDFSDQPLHLITYRDGRWQATSVRAAS